MPTSRSYSKLRAAFIFTAAVALFLLTVVLFRPENDLVERAREVPLSISSHRSGNTLYWLDDSSFLSVESDGPGLRIIRLDETLGTESVLARCRKPQWWSPASPSNLILSPDRSHVLYSTFRLSDDWCILDTNGRDRGKLPVVQSRGPGTTLDLNKWLGDSRTVVTFVERNSNAWACVTSIDRMREYRQIPILTDGLPSISGPAFPSFILGFDPRGRMISTTLRPGQEVAVWFAAFVLQANVKAQTWCIMPPADSVVEELTLSPQGDRLLWKLRFRRISTYQRLMTRIPGIPRPAPAVSDELWVSGLDGKDLRPIGAHALPPGHSQPPVEEVGITHVRWSPSGKRVSFVHQNRLYTLDVP